MRQRSLASVLLVKAVEEADGEGTLLPVADRAAASREVVRGQGETLGAASLASPEGPCPAPRRASSPRARASSAPGCRRGSPWWTRRSRSSAGPGGSAAAPRAGLRGRLRAFGAGRPPAHQRARLPLLGLVLWSVLVYVGVGIRWIRALGRRGAGRARLASLLAQWGLASGRRVVARSAAFNVRSPARSAASSGSGRTPRARPRGPGHAAPPPRGRRVGARAHRGFYLRGLVLDYQAGWESTFLTAEQAHALLRVAYGPASLLTGIPVPDAAHLAAIRWPGAPGGESAAPWIHLLAATAFLFVVLPRLALALGASRRRVAPRPSRGPAVVAPAYFRRVFAQAVGGGGRGIVAVVPYAYAPSAAAAAALARLLPTALGEHLAVDMRAPVGYGEEDDLIEHLAERGGALADVIALLFTLAATPEDQNHGTMITGVRDWLVRSHRQAELLVLVDEGPYAERMGGPGGPRASTRRAPGRLGGLRDGARPHGLRARSCGGAADGGPGARRRPAAGGPVAAPPPRDVHVSGARGPHAVVTLSLVSHTNVGKTTLARTLLRQDVGEVRDQAHVTESPRATC